jgi:hypothetical protein
VRRARAQNKYRHAYISKIVGGEDIFVVNMLENGILDIAERNPVEHGNGRVGLDATLGLDTRDGCKLACKTVRTAEKMDAQE